MKFLFFYLILFTLVYNAQSQIEIGGSSGHQQKENEKAVIKNIKSLNSFIGSKFYVISNWSRTNRLLLSNGKLFGDTLGKRANETSLDKWSFGIGVQNNISNHFFWDGGVSLLRNGESYSYKDLVSDSSYSYQSNYSYFGMPVRINFIFGHTVRFYAGIGLVPQMFLGFRQNREWTKSSSTSENEKIDIKSGYNSFILSGLGNVGVLINFQNQWHLLVSPELRWQFNSSLPKQDAYIHKARCFGVSFGLARNI